MEKLNIDCLEEIMKYLSIHDKMNLAATNEQNRKVFVQWTKCYCKIPVHKLPLTIEEEKKFLRLAGECLESYELNRDVFGELTTHCKNLNCLELFYPFDESIESKNQIISLSNLQALETFTYTIAGTKSNYMMEVLVQTLARLPKLRAISLPCKSYKGKYLETLTQVEILQLVETANLSLEHFTSACKNIKNLRFLQLTWLTNSCKYNADYLKLSAISQYCKNLEKLILSFVAGPFEEIFNLPRLKFIVIEDSCLLNSLEVLAAKKANTLEYLQLTGITANPGYAIHIGQMIALRELHCKLEANDVEQLANLNQLRYLILDCEALSDVQALGILEKCPKLVGFKVNSHELTESFFAAAGELLRRLRENGLRENDKLELGLSLGLLDKFQNLVARNNSNDLQIHTTFCYERRSTKMELFWEESTSLRHCQKKKKVV